jgi:hypothetical protein
MDGAAVAARSWTAPRGRRAIARIGNKDARRDLRLMEGRADPSKRYVLFMINLTSPRRGQFKKRKEREEYLLSIRAATYGTCL